MKLLTKLWLSDDEGWRRITAPIVEYGLNWLSHRFFPKGIRTTILSTKVSGEIDLLSIDIDGNDYWVWEAISEVQPRVVVIEYNAVFRPPLSIVADYKKDFVWDGTSYYGASLKALELLGSRKGYALIGCSLSGINAFFVRQDLLEDKFCEPWTAENHFEPPRFGFYKIGALDMHPPGAGIYRSV